MIDRSDRHRVFSRRLLEAMGLGSVAGLALAGAACGGTVIESSGSTGSGGETTTTTTSTSSSTGAGGSCAGPVTPPEKAVTGCIPMAGGVCPAVDAPGVQDEVAASLGLCSNHDDVSCCAKPTLMALACAGEPTPGPTCCYVGFEAPSGTCPQLGRPFTTEGGAARAAPIRARADWSRAAAPAVDGLDPRTRRALADAWTHDARYEHASIASFARLALELLAVGAPPDLVRDAQEAMGDEIRHAERCFALASAYAATPVGPGPLPFEDALPRASLADVAAAAVREGCIGETIAALAAAETRDAARDPAVRAALDAIAAEEAEHATMSWRLCAWAHRSGDASVREAIRAAFASPFDLPVDAAPEGIDEDAFRAHGRLLPREAREHALRAFAEVVRPSAAALLDALPASPARADG